jgi:hypothetical protein
MHVPNLGAIPMRIIQTMLYVEVMSIRLFFRLFICVCD